MPEEIFLEMTSTWSLHVRFSSKVIPRVFADITCLTDVLLTVTQSSGSSKVANRCREPMTMNFVLAMFKLNLLAITAKLREAFLFQVPNSFGIFLITFAILKNPFANPLKKVANLLMEFAMFLS